MKRTPDPPCPRCYGKGYRDTYLVISLVFDAIIRPARKPCHLCDGTGEKKDKRNDTP